MKPRARVDAIFNGKAYGDVADRLLAANGDVGALRPFLTKSGRAAVRITNDHGERRTVYTNSPAALPKESWLMFDEAVVRAARPQLRLWGDLVSNGLTFNVPNGMGTTVIQYQSMTDAGEAGFSMDGLKETRADRTLFDLKNLPLPIVHAEFSFSLREIMAAKKGQYSLDTTMLEQNTRKCVEAVEKLTLGTLSSYTYGGGTIYGLTNYPDRITRALTLPTAVGWKPSTFIDEVLAMIQDLQDIYFNGPYGVWVSPSWTKYLDGDYADTYGGKTLRMRLKDIEDLKFVNKTDYLSGFQILVVQLSPWVVQAVTGMKLQTLMWDSKGGLQKNFKIMGIMVPRVRSNSDGDTGIAHGVAS